MTLSRSIFNLLCARDTCATPGTTDTDQRSTNNVSPKCDGPAYVSRKGLAGEMKASRDCSVSGDRTAKWSFQVYWRGNDAKQTFECHLRLEVCQVAMCSGSVPEQQCVSALCSGFAPVATPAPRDDAHRRREESRHALVLRLRADGIWNPVHSVRERLAWTL